MWGGPGIIGLCESVKVCGCCASKVCLLRTCFLWLRDAASACTSRSLRAAMWTSTCLEAASIDAWREENCKEEGVTERMREGGSTHGVSTHTWRMDGTSTQEMMVQGWIPGGTKA